MEKVIADKILDIQEVFRNDPEYERLWREQENCNTRFLEVLEELTQEQRAAVEDYIGVLTEIQLRMLVYIVS